MEPPIQSKMTWDSAAGLRWLYRELQSLYKHISYTITNITRHYKIMSSINSSNFTEKVTYLSEYIPEEM